MPIDTTARTIYYAVGILRMVRTRVGLISMDLVLKEAPELFDRDVETISRVKRRTADLVCLIDRAFERLTAKSEDLQLWVAAVDSLPYHDAADLDESNAAYTAHFVSSDPQDEEALVKYLRNSWSLLQADHSKHSPHRTSLKRSSRRAPAPSSDSDDPSAA